MNLKKVLSIVVAGVLVIICAVIFLKVCAFEAEKKNNPVNYQDVTAETIQQLYSYLPIEDEENSTSMYNSYFTKYQNLSYNLILKTIYNYIVRYDDSKLQNITIDDLKNKNIIKKNENENQFTALYKIDVNDFENTGKLLYGSEEKIPRINFEINNINGFYVENDGYYIYRKENNKENEENYFIEKKLGQYTITDNGETIIINDYFVKCNIKTGKCYDDTKMTVENPKIQMKDGKTNFVENISFVKKYKHTYKYEDGHYYWYSSEIE